MKYTEIPVSLSDTVKKNLFSTNKCLNTYSKYVTCWEALLSKFLFHQYLDYLIQHTQH